MEVVNQLLTEAGGIVDDFEPPFQLDVIYGDERISLGDQVSPAQVQHRPQRFEYLHDPAYPEILETFTDPATLITVVMTDPDPVGGEYLHWLSTYFMADQQAPVMQWQDLVSYEAPRAKPMGTRKIIFTVFKSDKSLPNITIPESRNNFSKKSYAYDNGFGDPLAASFFKIIGPYDNGYQD